MIPVRDLGVAGLLAMTAFSASFTLTRPSARDELEAALLLVASDSAHVVCRAGTDCLRTDAARTLFVFFDPSDCSGALYDTAVLDEVYRGTPRSALNVVGVAYGMDAGEARAFALASGVTYPLYSNPERLERFVRNPRSELTNRPVKVLVDRDGRVVKQWISEGYVRLVRDDARRLQARLGAR